MTTGPIRVIVALLVMGGVVGACGNPIRSPEPSAPASVSEGGSTRAGGAQLVLVAWVKDNQDIYLAELPGRLTRLTHDPLPDGVPVWSPNGARLAFVRFAEDGSSSIHVINADGSNDHALTNQAGKEDILPTWSPDGEQIAFARVTGNGGMAGDSEIFTIQADGTGLRQVTNKTASRPNDPAWSPDGSLIAFDAGDPQPALYVIDPAGGDARRLTSPDGQFRTDWPLLWSPDSSALAFAATGSDGTQDVEVVSRDGATTLDLTNGGGSREGPPAWSPDGQRLAFWSNKDGEGDIYVVAREGGTARRLTTGSHLSGVVTLAWSPDGGRLVVWNSPAGQENSTNYILDAGGGVVHPLATVPTDELMAFWRPVR